jgi:uncharacterized protein
MELDPSILEQKERALYGLLRDCASVIIGYSGGGDSAYLAKAAVAALGGGGVLAVTGLSPSYPAIQLDMARRVAAEIDVPHLEIETREFDDPMVRLARERGYAAVLDGSNADDLDDHRPGHAAARELGVRSPLQEVGLGKAEIRWLSRRAALPTWDVPASPCLASRVAYGSPVTPQRLHRIEEAESRLRDFYAWSELRVRYHDGLARLEVGVEDLSQLTDPRLRAQTVAALKSSGFARACVDLQGYRRGALNEVSRSGDAEAMSAGDGRITPAGSWLARLGLNATIERAGNDGEVTVISPDSGSFARLLTEQRAPVLEHCSESGDRYVTLKLY